MKPSSNHPATVQVNGKRRNVPLSCAECRRLKLKCSREFPCLNCVKKGCEAICPEGSLTTGKGNRFVLANTEFLHEKINTLSSRVRQLEDALQDSHSKQSTEPHPLLTEELLKLKKPLEKGNEVEHLQSSETTSRNQAANGINLTQPISTEELIDKAGSLSLRNGRDNWHGASANAFDLLKNEEFEEELDEDDLEINQTLPDCVPWLSYSFPYSPNTMSVAEDIRFRILHCLPYLDEAKELSDIYFQHAAWMYTPITEDDYSRDVFALFYGHNAPAALDESQSHKLGLLFLVFAMGKLMDLRESPTNTQEAMRYYQIGRAALTIEPVLEARSIYAIQALLIMCHFMFFANLENSRWVIMGLVVKLAQSMGLHRDGANFRLSPEETTRRRSLMWEIYTYDSWQSLTFGRPISFTLASIDCQIPQETSKNENGDLEMTFSAWKHRFSSQCLGVVHDQAFGARTPNYKVIQELDKKVRNFYIPPSLRVPGFSGQASTETERPSLQLTLQRYITFAIKEISIFYMHRGYFAKSVEDNKEDPLSGKYGSSVLAAYNSAYSFTNLVRSLHAEHPGIAERMWFLFTHVFSCSIVLGSIATKCPGFPFAGSAFSTLQSACNLFDSVSHHPRAAKVLPVIKRLWEKAVLSMAEYESRRQLLPHLSIEGTRVKTEEDELSALGGKTRLVNRKSPPAPNSRGGTVTRSSLSPGQSNSAVTRSDSRSPPQYVDSPPPMSTASSTGSTVSSPLREWLRNQEPVSQQQNGSSSGSQMYNGHQMTWENAQGRPESQYSQPFEFLQHQWAMDTDAGMPANPSVPGYGSSSLDPQSMMMFAYPQQQQQQQYQQPQQPMPPYWNPAPQIYGAPANELYQSWQTLQEQTLQGG